MELHLLFYSSLGLNVNQREKMKHMAPICMCSYFKLEIFPNFFIVFFIVFRDADLTVCFYRCFFSLRLK